MHISEIELREFVYRLEDVGTHRGHMVYEPGSILEPPGFVLTIRSNTGVEGHYRGFCFVPPMLTQVKMAAGQLIGRDPLHREALWQDMFHEFRHTDRLGMGAIDIALWDLAGKHHDASVSTLLGGYRESVPAYSSTFQSDIAEDGLNTPESYAAFAEECRDRGYPAYKIHPPGNPDEDIAICRAVADAVGDEIDLMLDVASEYETYADALRVGRVLDELEFFWYEDPLSDAGLSTYSMRRLTEDLRTPVLGLEHDRSGPYGRVNHLTANALDMVRASVHEDGGITGVMKIAHLTESFGLDIELHIGGPATLHCMSAIRNTNYFEHAIQHPCDISWMGDHGFTEDVEEVLNDGSITIPDGPGLGVNLDWDFIDERTTETTLVDSSGYSGLP